MSLPVIQVENLSKEYRLGLVGTGTIAHDLNRFWCRIRGKEDPTLKIGQTNDRTKHSPNSPNSRLDSDYVWALKDINFEVKQGEVLGIIGRNGAGKSTLLKILSRVTAPTTGNVRVHGRIASLLEVGTGFHPELTGRENIYLNGAIMGMTKAEVTGKLDEIVEFSGCERYIDTPVKRYSSGMTVRLGFAVAAHLEPEILIVDEVLAVGDAEFQKKCIGKMQSVSQSGRTVLFVSHNMQAVSELTQNCMYLMNGRKLAYEETDKAIARYLTHHSSKDLVYHNRKDDGSAHIRRVELTTSKPGNVHVCGSPFIAQFDVSLPSDMNGAAFSFQIVDQNLKPVVHQWILDDPTFCTGNAGLYRLECSFPSLRLYMGNYRLVCYLSEAAGGKRCEKTEPICPFEVVMFGKERSFKWHADACVYLEKSEWLISKEQEDEVCDEF